MIIAEDRIKGAWDFRVLGKTFMYRLTNTFVYVQENFNKLL